MQFTTVAAVAALAATVAAWPSNSSSVAVDYVTEVFTAYTTYCPEATQVSFNGITYTISEVSWESEGVQISGMQRDEILHRISGI
jgi:hypothetical protein